MAKLSIKKISNEERYNEIDIPKSEVFLENLQDFVRNIGMPEEHTHEVEGKEYDMTTLDVLFYEDPKDEFNLKRRKIEDFNDGNVVRYFSKEIELLVIFLQDKIKLIFYCNEKNRAKVINALRKFVNM